MLGWPNVKKMSQTSGVGQLAEKKSEEALDKQTNSFVNRRDEEG